MFLAGPEQPVSPEIFDRWRPVEASAIDSASRLPVYQMGNNEYHEEVLRLALEQPGVVTLHDVVLHHLLVERTLGKALLEPYLEQLARDHGWVGERAGGGGARASFGESDRSIPDMLNS